VRLLAAALALVSVQALAQYDGPAVEACRAYAKREAARDGATVKEVLFERDPALLIERYTRKVGSQFVSSILTGNGSVVMEGTPSIELSFICLLASDKQPVFFNWLPRADAPAFEQCARDAGLRARPRSCLEALLNLAERDLGIAYAARLQEANAKGGGVLAAYRKANEAWREYRDAECARRRDFVPAGSSAEDYQLGCVIELTRRRALDMR
jgi:uncharacterized protein YecT (DUF1311 family)